jgi:hypothetical protein
MPAGIYSSKNSRRSLRYGGHSRHGNVSVARQVNKRSDTSLLTTSATTEWATSSSEDKEVDALTSTLKADTKYTVKEPTKMSSIQHPTARIHTSATITPEQSRVSHKRKIIYRKGVPQPTSSEQSTIVGSSSQQPRADLARESNIPPVSIGDSDSSQQVARDDALLDDAFGDSEDARAAKRPKTKAKKVVT